MKAFSIPERKKFSFSTDIPILIEHINYGNHLGHDSLISILHEARIRFLKSKNFSEAGYNDIGLIMTSLCVNYRSEAFYGEILHIEIEPIRKGLCRCDFLYKICEKTSLRLVAEALTSMAFYDYKKKKLAKIPTSFPI